jgi:hypothetical protein
VPRAHTAHTATQDVGAALIKVAKILKRDTTAHAYMERLVDVAEEVGQERERAGHLALGEAAHGSLEALLVHPP